MNKKEQIQEILHEFNFDNVHYLMSLSIWPVYNDYGIIIDKKPWSWLNVGVPNVNKLKEFALQLLLKVSENSDDTTTTIESGGFKASNYSGKLCLEFVVENYLCD